MPLTGPLTDYDLDEIGSASFDTDQPLELVAELVDAVERGQLADPADTGYALILAAEITDRAGDLQAAHQLAERAVAANRLHGDPDYGYPRAFHAELLLRLGREDEAMAELKALRPLLSEDIGAVSYISQALERGGRAEIAEQWLTAALVTLLQHQQEPRSLSGEAAYGQAATMTYILSQHRQRIRRDLDLPPDEYDALASQLRDLFHRALGEPAPGEDAPGSDEILDDDETLDDVEQDYDGVVMLFWPQAEFGLLLQRWPSLADFYGRNWDEHRTMLQRSLVQWSESGQSRLELLAGAVDELVNYASREGRDPTDPQVRQSYAQHLTENARETRWPPGRNDACWCGSGLKYKKCCLPRTRL